MNYEGLRRRGFSPARVAAVRAMHRALYREGATLEQSVQRIAALAESSPEAAADVTLMTDFLARVTPQRGIVR
jgi:UDP-N-acetylglucosamine acyltransferase